MGDTEEYEGIEEAYEDVAADVSREEFREAVDRKVEQMGGLADEETAAMLVVHELDEDGDDVETVADVEPGMDEVAFAAKVTDVGDLRTFERDDDSEGRVLNAQVADETGSIRITFWDGMAVDAADHLAVGDVVRVGGRPRDGDLGLEVHVDDVDPDPDVEVDVQVGGITPVEDLALGMSDLNVRGRVLEVGTVRTFEKDDGSGGRVANLSLGDETGRIPVTGWGEMADRLVELDAGDSVEVVDGYTKDNEGELELHVNDRSAVEVLEEPVRYEPDATPIGTVEIGQRVDLAGVVRSADPKRTFERDDGSEGQVRNVRVQDDTGDIRVALWGGKADLDVAPGDRILVADVEIEDGWRDDLEASANWQSTVTVLDDDPAGTGTGAGDEGVGSGDRAADPGTDARSGGDGDAGAPAGGDARSGDGDAGTADLDAFSGSGTAGGPTADDTGTDTATGTDTTTGADTGPGTDTTTGTPGAGADTGGERTATFADAGAEDPAEHLPVEFTGTVVQAGDPVVLDDGESTMSVETDADLRLGEEVTVRGRMRDGRLVADRVR